MSVEVYWSTNYNKQNVIFLAFVSAFYLSVCSVLCNINWRLFARKRTKVTNLVTVFFFCIYILFKTLLSKYHLTYRVTVWEYCLAIYYECRTFRFGHSRFGLERFVQAIFKGGRFRQIFFCIIFPMIKHPNNTTFIMPPFAHFSIPSSPLTLV